MTGIYKITSPSGKVYIGQSKDIEKRKRYYKRHACKNQTRLYNSLECHGFDAHTFEVICECSLEDLNNLEVYYIELFDSFRNGLNLVSGGNRPEYSEETRKRMVENRKPLPDESRKAISDYAKTRVGDLNPMFGRRHSEETRIKIAEKATGRVSKLKGVPSGRKGEKRVFSEAHKLALSKSRIGILPSEETRKKLSLVLIGKPSRNKGKKINDTTRAKMSIASKLQWTPERREAMSLMMKSNTRQKGK